MKHKTLLKALKPALILLSIAFVLVLSCKKKDDVPYTPVQPGPVPPPVTSNVFTNRPIHMMSDYETANHKDFPGHIIRRIGKGLYGEEGPGFLDPLKEVGELVWEIHDYEKTEADFDKIDDGLNNLKGQVASLNQTIVSMGTLLNISITDINDLTAYMSTGDLNTQIGYVQTAMGTSTEDEFMYYANISKAYKLDSTNPANIAQMNALKAYAPTYALNVYHNITTNSMQNIIQAMNEDLCPSLGTGNNALKAYAKAMVPLCQGQIKDSADAMHAYLMLESYFLTVVNYQFQAATVMINACNMLDSTGQLGYATTFWNGTVIPKIQPEIGVFLETVDYLVANIDDYRDSTRFKNDMQYADAGLAPDNIFIHVFARSQFIANLLNNALGVPSPVMCGHILVPALYEPAVAGSPATLSVTVGSKTLTATAVTVASQLPYTYWSVSDNVCSPDNNWNVYRFVSPDTTWPATSQVITVVESGDKSPWVHYTSMTGSISPQYFNPRNPDEHSSTRTDSCTVQLAYFSANWPWGYLYLANSTCDSGWSHTAPFDFRTFNSPIWNGGSSDYATTPFAATTNKYHNLYFQTNGMSFSYPNNSPGTMQFSGNSSYTSDLYVVADNYYTTVTLSPVFPPVTGSLKAWACYKAYYGMGGSGGTDMTINIGTTLLKDLDYGSNYMYYVGTDVVRTNWHDMSGKWNSGFGMSGNLSGTGQFTPGVQYYYQTANIPNVIPAGITLQTAYQFVYGGFFSVPD